MEAKQPLTLSPRISSEDECSREFTTAWHLALKFLGYRARSINEIKQYLAKKSTPATTIDQVVERLLESRLLDDFEFARMFVSNRKRTAPRSIFAMEYELSRKGIDAKIIEKALKDETDDDLACLAVQLKMRSWRRLDPEKARKKALTFLKNRGFTFQTAMATVDKITDELKEQGK